MRIKEHERRVEVFFYIDSVISNGIVRASPATVARTARSLTSKAVTAAASGTPAYYYSELLLHTLPTSSEQGSVPRLCACAVSDCVMASGWRTHRQLAAKEEIWRKLEEHAAKPRLRTTTDVTIPAFVRHKQVVRGG